MPPSKTCQVQNISGAVDSVASYVGKKYNFLFLGNWIWILGMSCFAFDDLLVFFSQNLGGKLELTVQNTFALEPS